MSVLACRFPYKSCQSGDVGVWRRTPPDWSLKAENSADISQEQQVLKVPKMSVIYATSGALFFGKVFACSQPPPNFPVSLSNLFAADVKSGFDLRQSAAVTHPQQFRESCRASPRRRRNKDEIGKRGRQGLIHRRDTVSYMSCTLFVGNRPLWRATT